MNSDVKKTDVKKTDVKKPDFKKPHTIAENRCGGQSAAGEYETEGALNEENTVRRAGDPAAQDPPATQSRAT